MNEPNLKPEQMEYSMAERWDAVALPGSDATEKLFSNYLQTGGDQRRILNCAIPLTRALELTRFSLPGGVTASDCLIASVKGNFPDSLRGWSYTPKIRAVPQLPPFRELPAEYRHSLGRLPWFERATPAGGLAINARHLRYHHALWHELRAKTIQGLTTTLVLALPQIAFALTPHVQLERIFLFLAALARGLAPVQLFPARYLYPDADLFGLADAPTPIFADLLPATGGFAYPLVDGEPDPWRTLCRLGSTDRYYGYPFRQATDAGRDFNLSNLEPGLMLLPCGRRVNARHSHSRVLATLDPSLNRELRLDRETFAATSGWLRATVTHDGLPFQLPVEMQPLIHAVILTHYQMDLDHRGDLSSYTLSTQHAAIGGFHYFQRVEPFYSNFQRLLNEVCRDRQFCTYPLSTHLNQSWLGGNLQLSNQRSASERDHDPGLLRAYGHQQLDWMMGVTNLTNHVAFRTRHDGGRRVARTGVELEQDLDFDGLAFHQMNRLLRVDSCLFSRPTRAASPWPGLHPGFAEIDQRLLTESLPRL